MSDHVHLAPARERWAALESGWDLLILVCLGAIAVSYVVAVTRLWRTAGTGQGTSGWHVAAFAAAWCTLVVALVSPLDTLSDVLFAAHMTQHELLMLVAAPLMVIARPVVPFLWLLPRTKRMRLHTLRSTWLRRVWTGLTGPVTALVVHGVVLWLWHVPALFEAAMADDGIHAAQHLLFFWTAALFWWAVVHGRYGRLGYGIAVAFVFATALHTSLLGALLTFAPRVWYPTYAVSAPAAGISAIDDQQLAGLLMWIPSGVVFMLVGLALLAAWLGEIERRTTLRSVTQCRE